MSQETSSLKIVLVGDSCVGKTALLLSYATECYPTTYSPTILENYDLTIRFQSSILSLKLWDTSGHSDYSDLRPLTYAAVNVFLICFSLGNEASFDHALNKWLPEVYDHCPLAEVILVGTQSDLLRLTDCTRDALTNGTTTNGTLANGTLTNGTLTDGTKIIESMEKQIKMYGCDLMCCSAYKQEGLTEVFEKAIGLALRKKEGVPCLQICKII